MTPFIFGIFFFSSFFSAFLLFFLLFFLCSFVRVGSSWLIRPWTPRGTT